MNIRLTQRDRAEVQSIADSLPDDDLQEVAGYVDDWQARHQVNPLTMAAIAFLSQHYDRNAVAMLDHDDDWHIKLGEVLRELMIDTGKRERGVNALIHKVA
ncbi:hypothetical protein HA48_14715 [Pantoea wallisii]|uniref:Uncharacterized protein n=1 Tax=Pantoea wallisii TaxID=1076551 RepID=A0A1X1D6U8_9GAMM|nr:hypothetical protein [Pantoea wallisii]ORM72405.1 hypothetical protein HA48_14715 [Pantoea wallisii]